MDYNIGLICLFPYNFTPMGWLLCNGQAVSIMQYQALYALIGSAYGGDGRTTFVLPNLQGAEPHPAIRYFIATEGLYPSQS
jgi:microcystin-dependent protein